MSVPLRTTSLLRRLRKWVTKPKHRERQRHVWQTPGQGSQSSSGRESHGVRRQLLHPHSREYSINNGCLVAIKGLGHMLLVPIALSVFFFFPPLKKPFLLYLFIPRGTINCAEGHQLLWPVCFSGIHNVQTLRTQAEHFAVPCSGFI